MVAKTYQSWKVMSKPYTLGGKTYVSVSKPLQGITKQVRYYTPDEYYSLYPEEMKILRPQRDVLGFEKGYITIFKGNEENCNDWFKENHARYTTFWGWGFDSTKEVPQVLPAGLTPVKLEWDKICDDSGLSLKNKDDVRAYVDSLLYDQTGNYVGEIGDRVTEEMTVTRAIPVDNSYGHSTAHTLMDSQGNTYIWFTSAKQLIEGKKYGVTGTIKDHNVYRGTKQTVLTRCRTTPIDAEEAPADA